MNEEKYNELLEDGELFDYIEELQQENHQLKDRIKKVIKHTEKYTSGIICDDGEIVMVTPSADILKILKGE